MKKKISVLPMIVFLLGIFMGAIDSGIVSPARTLIANSFNLADSSSVWVITIYTLAFAVSMPITAKLSDRYGRRKVYMISITIFAIGSLLCGISNFYGNYAFLLGSRVVQAIGSGGILPIATAYIGSSFDIEERGTALGLVGGVFGISTIIGPSIGSFILDIFGANHWGYLFFINIPISIVIILLAFALKENKEEKKLKKMDIMGCIMITLVILSLMYALTNLNFHSFGESLKSIEVWPYLLGFVIFLPVLIWVEKKAEDPVLNLHYFTNKQILVTLGISFIVGCGLMGSVFLPQFGENVLKLEAGSGGYIITLLAVFAGIASPIAGKCIDKMGVKKVLIMGFTFTIIGSLYQALVTANNCSFANLFIGLAFMGLGMGFNMGPPANYLMMSLVPQDEITQGQSTVSLVRSIGVAISPNILVNFIADAGSKIPTAIQKALPTVQGMPANAFASGGNMPADLLSKFQNADVTTVFSVTKEFISKMLDTLKPMISKAPNANFDAIKTGYLNTLETSKAAIESAYQTTLNGGFTNLFIAAAVIAGVGFILALMIKSNKKNPTAN